MKVNVAHLRERSKSGGWVDFAVFDARSTTGSSQDNDELLQQLIARGRAAGLKIDKGALAFERNGRIVFYGAEDVVEYLQGLGVPEWTHTIDV